VKVCLDINRPSHGRTYPAQLEIGDRFRAGYSGAL
jgi:hypothetical protein